jgi:hypothetical protein
MYHRFPGGETPIVVEIDLKGAADLVEKSEIDQDVVTIA